MGWETKKEGGKRTRGEGKVMKRVKGMKHYKENNQGDAGLT